MSNKQNVIWIFGDQHRGQALSCMGDTNVHTPNIDMLAVDGMTFAEARSGVPLFCPFRGSLLTGLYPLKCVPGHEYQKNPTQPTIANVFNENGYDTAYFGKWHVDGFKEKNGRAGKHIIPPERRGGFKKWLGYENNNSQWDSWVCGNIHGEEVQYRLPGYETDCLTDIMIEYLDEKSETQDEPFFAVLSVQPPHDPYTAPTKYMEKHNPANIKLRPNVPEVASVTDVARRELAGYYSQIENLDYNVGRIVEKLHKTGQIWNTHIIFFSDHGDMHGSHGMFKKTNPYEESVRIPFIISGAGRRYNPYNTGRSDAMINHVDIAPTTLSLCDIPVPEWMEGTDYSSHRMMNKTKSEEPDSIFMQSVIPTRHGDSTEFAWRGIVTNDGWKYVCFEHTHWLLFNLKEDPYEQVNLAHNSIYAEKRTELKDRLKKWIIETGDEFNLPK
jgi:arylsulfatase A-like enzyme